MKLDKLQFTNFRCFRREEIELADYVSFVGPNNCGKSTILTAISALYDESVRGSTLASADFHVDAGEADLHIRYEFSDLTEQACADLSHYVRNGRVVFDLVASRSASGGVSTKCRGVRYGLPQLAPFFAAPNATAKKSIYERLRGEGAHLPPWKNMGDAEAALRDFEGKRDSEHVAIPSEENAYGAAGPIHKIRRHLDWIYVPAVKDVSAEASELRNSAFSKLILLAIRSKHNFSEKIKEIQDNAGIELKKAIEDSGDALKDVGGDIDKLFKSLTTSRVDVALQWDNPETLILREPTISTIFKDGRVLGAPEIFGHGLQRTYLMALLSLAAR